MKKREDRLSGGYHHPQLPLGVWRFTVKTTETTRSTNKPKTTKGPIEVKGDTLVFIYWLDPAQVLLVYNSNRQHADTHQLTDDRVTFVCVW